MNPAQHQDWAPWIEHDGKRCPIPNGTECRVIVEMEPGRYSQPVLSFADDAGLSWNWRYWGCVDPKDDQNLIVRVVKYQTRKPRAMEGLKAIAENVPVAKEMVDA